MDAINIYTAVLLAIYGSATVWLFQTSPEDRKDILILAALFSPVFLRALGVI